jgi:hypothetical protein
MLSVRSCYQSDHVLSQRKFYQVPSAVLFNENEKIFMFLVIRDGLAKCDHTAVIYIIFLADPWHGQCPICHQIPYSTPCYQCVQGLGQGNTVEAA